uniref:Uncharacterized protein n=1 Tax=Lepeophtheirus salmonis TaxID=72036 RepID=A0A0K2TMN4_LEPSM
MLCFPLKGAICFSTHIICPLSISLKKNSGNMILMDVFCHIADHRLESFPRCLQNGDNFLFSLTHFL